MLGENTLKTNPGARVPRKAVIVSTTAISGNFSIIMLGELTLKTNPGAGVSARRLLLALLQFPVTLALFTTLFFQNSSGDGGV